MPDYNFLNFSDDVLSSWVRYLSTWKICRVHPSDLGAVYGIQHLIRCKWREFCFSRNTDVAARDFLDFVFFYFDKSFLLLDPITSAILAAWRSIPVSVREEIDK